MRGACGEGDAPRDATPLQCWEQKGSEWRGGWVQVREHPAKRRCHGTAPVRGARPPPAPLPPLLAPPSAPGRTGRCSGGACRNGEIRIHQKHLKSIKSLPAVCFPFGEVAARLHGPAGMRVRGHEARGGPGSLRSEPPGRGTRPSPQHGDAAGCEATLRPRHIWQHLWQPQQPAPGSPAPRLQPSRPSGRSWKCCRPVIPRPPASEVVSHRLTRPSGCSHPHGAEQTPAAGPWSRPAPSRRQRPGSAHPAAAPEPRGIRPRAS